MAFAGFGASLGGGERKTGTLFGQNTAPAGGLFSSQQQQNTAPQGGLFSSQQQQPPPPNPVTSLFSSQQPQQQPPQQNYQPVSSLFSNPNAPFAPVQQQGIGSMLGHSQQQQQQMMNNSIFGGSLQPGPSLNASQIQAMSQSQQGLPQLRRTVNDNYPSSSINGAREKSVPDQIRVLHNKWNPENPDCAFQFYFYNSVEPDKVPFYGPQPHEDERKWDEALSSKPSPNSIPILARGFEEIANRIKYQNMAVIGLRTRLHEIDESLKLLSQAHNVDRAQRILKAQQNHILSSQRTLALATKVQILRNRGYDMDQAEEGLKKKLIELEKKTFDPVLGGRQEEIWARMSGVRERARILQTETEKLGKAVEGQQNGELLSEDDQKQLQKLLKDYDKQLEHLKKWVDDTKQEYEDWETAKQPAKTTKR